MLGIFKLRKVGLIIIAVLVLALGVLVLREHVWPPEEALARSSTLTALSGTEVTLNGKTIDEGKTVSVEEGDTIKTGVDSYALVTFEDGSTVELDPETEITISVLTDTKISVFQQVGQTWTGVKKLASGPINDFELNTPSAGAVVQGTLIDTLVDRIVNKYKAKYGAYEGTVQVTVGDIVQLVEAGMQSIIEDGSEPQLQSIPAPQERLEFTIDGDAWALVVDAQERSVGVVPPKIVVNQIPRSSTTGALAEQQFIVVPAPVSEGESTYYITLYGKEGAQDVNVTVTGYSKGKEIFTESKKNVNIMPYDKSNDGVTKYVAALKVNIDVDKLLTDTVELSNFLSASDYPVYEVKKGNWPGHIEIKDWATANADLVVAPQANFSASMGEDTGTINFTNFSTGDITGYSWDFGDGKTSTEISPSHVFETGNQYAVSLTVYGVPDESNLEIVPTDTMIITIYVFNLP